LTSLERIKLGVGSQLRLQSEIFPKYRKRSIFAENREFLLVKNQHFFMLLLFFKGFCFAKHCGAGITSDSNRSKKIIPKNLR
jgi:hypothetical protein